MMLSTDLQPGGYPLRLARLAIALRDWGVEPIVGCLARRGPLHESLESSGIATFSADARGGFDATCLWRLARHVRRFDPDLIHAGLFHANLAARLVGRLDRARPIITSTITIEIERHWHRWGEALTGGWSELHIANAPSVAEHVRTDLGFSSDRVVLLRNGVDLAAVDQARPARRGELGIPEGVPLLIWAGRMDPIKDLQTFVETAARMHEKHGAHALLLGDGPERARVAEMTAQSNLTHVLHMPGWRGDVVSWLKSADVLVFPSRTEGSSNVMLEAMAAGCVVVASDIAPCRDLVASGVSGHLCRPGQVGEFAAACSELLYHPDRRQTLSRNARERVERSHSLPSVVENLAKTYRSTLSNQANVR